MFPFIDIAGITIHMTGIGIAVWVVVWLISLPREAKKYHLYTRVFLKRFPMYLLLVYLISTYSWYFVHDKVIFPLSFNQFLLYLSPRGYPFYLGGILIGIYIVWRQFVTHISPSLDVHAKWAYVFVKSAVLATIPLGIFLLLGDNFIGITYDNFGSVAALMKESNVATYGRVFPLGALLSMIAGGWWWYITRRLEQGSSQPWHHVYLLIAGLLISIFFILFLQIYPRYLVVKLGRFRFDIKHYILFITIGIALYHHYILHRSLPHHDH